MRLRLETGNEVEAWVHVAPSGSERPRCLLLHGNPGCSQDFAELVPQLANKFDLAAIDLPGFGMSRRVDLRPESLNLDRLAEHAMAAADALGWRRPFFLIGHSHGGGVAQVMAARYPERVAGLVLVATLGAPAHAKYRLLSLPFASAIARVMSRLFGVAVLRPLNRAIVRAVMSDLFSPQPVNAQHLERQCARFAAHPEILSSMVHVALGRPCERLLCSAADIRCPTLFLHGEEDAVVPKSHARAIHDLIVNAGGRSQFESIAGAGHMLIEHEAAELAEFVHRLNVPGQ